MRINPDSAEAHYSIGRVLGEKGLLDEEIEQHRKALKFDPEFEDAHYGLGFALEKKGLLDEAIKEFREALRINRESVVLWLKINRTKKRGNYPTPSLPSLVIVRNGLRQKKENFVSSSNLVLSFRLMASFITSQ